MMPPNGTDQRQVTLRVSLPATDRRSVATAAIALAEELVSSLGSEAAVLFGQILAKEARELALRKSISDFRAGVSQPQSAVRRAKTRRTAGDLELRLEDISF